MGQNIKNLNLKMETLNEKDALKFLSVAEVILMKLCLVNLLLKAVFMISKIRNRNCIYIYIYIYVCIFYDDALFLKLRS